METNSTDELIKNLSNADVDIRRKASADVQSLFCGSICDNESKRLLWALAIKLHIDEKGAPAEPDEYVRERCTDCFRLAAESSIDICTYLPVLHHTRDRDPHPWLKEAAEGALSVYEERFGLERKKFPEPKKENPAQKKAQSDPIQQPISRLKVIRG